MCTQNQNGQATTNNPLNDEIKLSLENMMKTVSSKIEEMNNKTQEQFRTLNEKIVELKEERTVQLKVVEEIVQRNKNKEHDVVTAMAFEVVESLHKAASGNPEALMETLFRLVPDPSKSLQAPPRMSEDLQTAVLNVVGLAVKKINNV